MKYLWFLYPYLIIAPSINFKMGQTYILFVGQTYQNYLDSGIGAHLIYLVSFELYFKYFLWSRVHSQDQNALSKAFDEHLSRMNWCPTVPIREQGSPNITCHRIFQFEDLRTPIWAVRLCPSDVFTNVDKNVFTNFHKLVWNSPKKRSRIWKRNKVYKEFRAKYRAIKVWNRALYVYIEQN